MVLVRDEDLAKKLLHLPQGLPVLCHQAPAVLPPRDSVDSSSRLWLHSPKDSAHGYTWVQVHSPRDSMYNSIRIQLCSPQGLHVQFRQAPAAFP